MEGWEVHVVISEVINGVLVFGPDDMTEEEYLNWRKEKVAETDLFWEELRMKYRNGGNERRIMDKVRDWLRFVRNRLRWI
jgi:hypothetical protein